MRVYDPVVKTISKDLDARVAFCEDKYEAATEADLLILVTEWKTFRSPDFSLLKKLMKSQYLIDGRNIWSKNEAEMNGFIYQGVGR